MMPQKPSSRFWVNHSYNCGKYMVGNSSRKTHNGSFLGSERETFLETIMWITAAINGPTISRLLRSNPQTKRVLPSKSNGMVESSLKAPIKSFFRNFSKVRCAVPMIELSVSGAFATEIN